MVARTLSCLALVALGAAPGGAEPAPAGAPADWQPTVSAFVRLSGDTNVFLQDTDPNPAIAGAARPRVASWVSTIGASVGISGPLAPDLRLAATYEPEASRFEAAHSEDNTVHRASVALAGTRPALPWSLQTALTWIDGSKDGPIFGGPGGVPAVGGIPLRDRRAAFMLRSAFKLTREFGPWFVRPVATLYLHDFRTRQSRAAGYENYIDRQEWVGGADFGRALSARSRIFAGFRYGRQDQLKLNGTDSPYDSTLRRFLAGFEGTPLAGLQVAILAGPETRTFAAGTPAGFDRHHLLWWIDASATATLGPRDVLNLALRRFEQPAFSSCSVYQDITYEVGWRHRFTPRVLAAAGFKAYNGAWQAPVVRDDWITTPSVSLQVTLNSRWRLDAAYAGDRAVSRVPDTAGREYQRHLGSLTARYTF